MRPAFDVIRELVAECDREAIGCDAKAQWLWAQDLDREAEDMVQLGATYQARSRALSEALEVLDPARVDARPQDPAASPGPSLRSNLRVLVNPEKIA